MTISGVHHISLNVSDAARANAFYTDVLGLGEIERPDLGFPGSWLELPDGRQAHLREVPGHQAPAGQHFAVRVDDIDEAIADLRGHGVDVGDPGEIAGVCRQAFFEDPSGNLIEFNQPTG